MRNVFVPFKIGDRNCAGQAMTWLELNLVVASAIVKLLAARMTLKVDRPPPLRSTACKMWRETKSPLQAT